jgi:hypothetical protein
MERRVEDRFVMAFLVGIAAARLAGQLTLRPESVLQAVVNMTVLSVGECRRGGLRNGYKTLRPASNHTSGENICTEVVNWRFARMANTWRSKPVFLAQSPLPNSFAGGQYTARRFMLTLNAFFQSGSCFKQCG